jgi:1-phosphatidylinositol-4-phosphate 5-kinase
LRDHAPRVYRQLREGWGVESQSYMYSLGPEKILGNLLVGSFSALCEVVSSGRSGSIFFKSVDNRFLIKTISPAEHAKLCEILPNYYQHVEANPNTLLTRILGCHQLKTNHNIDFVVMENVFFGGGGGRGDISGGEEGEEGETEKEMRNDGHPIHEQYDLKGSTIDRHVDVTPAQFSSVAMKDLDFQRNGRKINLPAEQRGWLLEQLEKDCRYLEDCGICDYSLLLGFHFLSPEESQSIKKRKQKKKNNNTHQQPEASLLLTASGTTTVSTLGTSLRWASIFRKDYGGILSANEDIIYYLGIIDHLTTFDLKKRAESSLKSIIHDKVFPWLLVGCCSFLLMLSIFLRPRYQQCLPNPTELVSKSLWQASWTNDLPVI